VGLATAIYTRISKDRDGNLLGTGRQERAGRKLADNRGWTVIETYVDDDRTAYKRGAPRPEYERLVRDIVAGRVKAVVAWDPDRLYRQMTDLEELVTLLEAHPVEVACVMAGDIDLSTAHGRLQARVAGAVARHESEHKAERLRAKHEELAERGRWSGGPRPYGYRPAGDGNLTVIPEEAEIVRELAARVLAGESVHLLCRNLEARGVPTARGAHWRPVTLSSMLRAPLIAGERRWHGEGPVKAVWEPIIDAATSARLRAALDPRKPRGVTPRVNWLAGLLVCGECGQVLRGMRRENGKRRFACPPGPSHRGCGRIEINTDPVEALMAEALFEVVDTPGLVGRRQQQARQRQRVDDPAALEEELGELAAMRGRGELTTAEWRAARAPLLARIEAARAAQVGAQRAQVISLYQVRSGGVRAAWDGLSIEQRQAVAGAVIEKIVVNKATRRGPIFDPGRLDITWRT
jgi:DNA invertase Pin-like site-specific DNA recombinase